MAGTGNKFALGAVIGIAAGVIAGLLTAPKSGKETRADLKQKAAELKDKAADKAEHVIDKVEDYKERGEQVASDVVEDVKRGFRR